MQIAFIYNHKNLSPLTKWFTGSRCYHVGFTDGEYFWDINACGYRRRFWEGKYPKERVLLVDCPVEITANYLNQRTDDHDNGADYGWRDYFTFVLRPLYKLIGKTVPNYKGTICSEDVTDVLYAHGWQQFFEVFPPSPADLEEVFFGERDHLNRLIKK